MSILNRLLIGPIISLATTGILYAGFFRGNPKANLAEMNGNNFATFILIGFLLHTYLNSGYYFFSARLLGEKGTKTLPLVWLAPCNKILLFFSFISVDLIRCLIITLLGIIIIGLPEKPFIGLVQEAGLFLFLMLLGMLLGLLRVILTMVRHGMADLFDNLYLIFVFTACPYIPKTLLPGFLQPLCTFNPAYHACKLMRAVWNGHSVAGELYHLLALATSFVVVSSAIYVYTRINRLTIIEKSF
ncbi:MAG: hypothetical protein HY537_17660 [Deltaproteobacteria bacterium]|nr:hypothetical protein [Deltaproteobacteria bacterium]